MSIKYVGLPSPWHGKALFEILVNLKDFGIGRMVVRSNFERYKEPTYYIIKKVAPKMDKDNKLGSVWFDVTFRGRALGVQEYKNVWKTDFKLIPKDEEADYKNYAPSPNDYLVDRIIPKFINMPPLLNDLLTKEKECEQKIETHLNDYINSRARIANDGEKPNVTEQENLEYFSNNIAAYEEIVSKAENP